MTALPFHGFTKRRDRHVRRQAGKWMPYETSEAVAVIGLGSMGLGMAGSLISAGMAVSGFDPAEAALGNFTTAGGRAARNPADAARDVAATVVVVVNAAQTETVLFGPEGVVPAMRRDGVVLSSATMAPQDARRPPPGAAVPGCRNPLSRCANERWRRQGGQRGLDHHGLWHGRSLCPGPACAREQSKSWGADRVGLGSELTGRGWAGGETGVAGEAGCGAAAWGDDGNRSRPYRAR